MLRLRAPAKLNLFLRVLSKRPDGYHEIETVFERLDLADRLDFKPAREGLVLTCDDPTLSCGPDNLILQAARLLREATGATAGARITLTKRIPVAAGLGGGSSDAATALLGLNELWRLGLSRAALAALGARVGSDVPSFLCDGPFVVGRGRGDRCEPAGRPRTLAQVVVTPPERLSAREVYAGSQFSLTAPEPSLTMLLHALSNGSLGELATGLRNDLEPEAIRRCPASARIQSSLREAGCLTVRVSGSGPSMFGLCRDAAHAQAVAQVLRTHAAPSWRIAIVQTDRSTLAHTPAVPVGAAPSA